MKIENREHEIKLIENINNIQRYITASNTMEDDVKTLQDKKSELQELQEKMVNGVIVRARAEYVEGGETILSTLLIKKRKEPVQKQ